MMMKTRILALLAAGSLGASMLWAAAPPKSALAITQVYTTAETTTSATVVWNTNVASDSLARYSTSNPVPPSAPQVYSPGQVTYHELPLTGLAPGTLYYFKVTSCARRECRTADGTFETSPSCPDTVPPVSGSWQKIDSPNAGGATPVESQLLGIAAVSDADVWAVGWARDPAGPPYVKRTFIQHFDGQSWRIVSSPNVTGDAHSELHSVAGASADDVWAVGSTHDGKLPSRTLIQRWDGTQWKIVPSPSPDSQFNELRGVAALSASDAWAVGYRGGAQAGPIETLVLRWDGVRWRQVPSPSVSGVANQLFGIDAISPHDIWAVGAAGGSPLAMRWNGSAWSLVAIPVGRGLSTERLAAVSGSAGSDVWAVGTGQGIFTNQRFATIKRWDGGRWTERVCYAASASNPPEGYEGGGPDAYFTGVSAAAGNDVWAVGVRGSGPMIVHWDGWAWTAVSHPRAFPHSASLHSVASSSGGAAWSAGIEIELDASSAATTVRTLSHRYTP